MKNDEIERQMMRLRYSIQDLDAHIAQMDLSEAQISSARQLADLHEKKDRLINERNLLRSQSMELEKQRQITLQEGEKNKDQQHKESMRLSRVAIWIDIILTVLGKVVK